MLNTINLSKHSFTFAFESYLSDYIRVNSN